MALISTENISRIEKNKNTVHKEVNCTYTIFVDNKGNKYIQLDTYGSKERQIPDKCSQSIQFDKETAQYLIKLLQCEFGL